MLVKEKLPVFRSEWWDGRRCVIASFLGILGCCGAQMKLLQLTHPPKEVPDIMEAFITSGAHPFLGMLGAATCAMVTRPNRSSARAYMRLKSAAAVAGGTALNFGIEALQSITIASPENVNFLAPQNMPETAKDYVFALGGVALYVAMDRSAALGSLRSNNRSLPQE